MKRVWSAFRELLPFLPPGARRFYFWNVGLTSALTVLDVLAMTLLVLIITPVASGQPITLPVVGQVTVMAVPWLVLIACLLILLKSAAAVAAHWVATRRFAKYEHAIGRRLFRAYLHSSWEERSKRSTVEITRISDTGVSLAIAGFLLPLATVPGNVLTTLLVVAVLVVAQPMVALVALVYLGGIAFLINRVVTRRTLKASRDDIDFSFLVARLMTEMVEALKELTLRGRLEQIQEVIAERRSKAIDARANSAFLTVIPRYAFEGALIGGFVIVGLAAYLFSGLSGALVAIALFAIAGFRLVPALIGIQSGLVTATGSVPWVQDVLTDLRGAEANVRDAMGGDDPSSLPEAPYLLHLAEVEFRYPGAAEPVLQGLDLSIPLGSSLGIVGPSGAGKSTLIDLLLGLSSPTSGQISIDKIPLTEVIHQWRSRVGYVPQKVALFDGSIAQNVALTWDDDFDRDKVLEVLEKAQLMSLVQSRGGGIDERIGERGVSLSGGQQQRLGIARALYSDPLVLVLDEATSALDTKTEDDVVTAIKSLQGQVTLIAVAHRISTIKDYDQICYLDRGRILGKGPFEQLAASLPQFGLQVQLAGLGGGIDDEQRMS